jgi:hypothetical protein
MPGLQIFKHIKLFYLFYLQTESHDIIKAYKDMICKVWATVADMRSNREIETAC